MPGDQRTFALLKEIADDIDPDIQFELDVPSLHPNGRLPCLDLQLWVDVDEEGVPSVKFEFFKKEMCSDLVVMKRSAISNQCKRSTLFSEEIKRLVNCSPELPWTTKAKHLSKFSFSL